MDRERDPYPGPDPEIGDAFGEILRARHEGAESYEIHERDDGWIAPLPGPDLYFSAYEDWPAHEREALAHVEGRVLDVGCGAGRHALYLQEQGHGVTAIDVSPGAVDVAADRGVEDVREVDVADVTTDLEGTFDTVLVLGTNFGVVGTRERAPVILTRLAAATTEDARILAGSLDPTATEDEAHLAYHERNRERGKLPGEIRLRIRFGTRATPWFEILHVAPDELREIATETPWEVAEVIDGEGGDGRYVARLVKG